jgi:Holliday junction resolvase-like predicted endonuclease
MKNLQTGNIGEEIACKFLESKGFKIVERNYRKKFAEIDIVARKGKIINFIEVKTAIKTLGLFDKERWQDKPLDLKRKLTREN